LIGYSGSRRLESLCRLGYHRYRERLGNPGSTWRHSRSRAFR
jgi:hypothetical protein